MMHVSLQPERDALADQMRTPCRSNKSPASSTTFVFDVCLLFAPDERERARAQSHRTAYSDTVS